MGLKAQASKLLSRLKFWGKKTADTSSSDAPPEPKVPDSADKPTSPSSSEVSPYGHKPKTVQRVVGPPGMETQPNGESWGTSEGVVAYVSRHGLQERGVTCPDCSTLVVDPGDWNKVSMSPQGEVVHCLNCRKNLLASPDDDIDPVKPGEQYNEDVYHRFARPKGWAGVRPRTTTDPVRVTDRVLIEEHSHTPDPVDGQEQSPVDLDGVMALVTGTDGEDKWRVALNADVGLGGAGEGHGLGGAFVSVPKSKCFRIPDVSLRVGDTVQVKPKKGAGAPLKGKIKRCQRGLADVAIEDGDLLKDLPIERIHKILANERPIGRVRELTPK